MPRSYAVTVNDGTATKTASVPFVDLGLLHAPIEAALQSEIAELVGSGRFVNGPQVAAFEEAFADWCGAAHCVGTASGLDALRLALVALGLEQGDEVVVPAMTFVATAEAVTQAGGRPVLADISECDWDLDPRRPKLRCRIAPASCCPSTCTARWRNGIPRDVAGRTARRSSRTPARHTAPSATGRARRRRRGGRIQLLPREEPRSDGRRRRRRDVRRRPRRARACPARARPDARSTTTSVEGWTSRLDTMQAVMLLPKLPLSTAGTRSGGARRAFYADALAGVGDLVLPPVPAGSAPVWHLYVVRTVDPEALAAHLARARISAPDGTTRARSPDGAYAWLGYRRGAFPVAEALAASACRCHLPGDHRRAARGRAAGVREYFAAWLTARRTTRRTSSWSTSSSARRSSSGRS